MRLRLAQRTHLGLQSAVARTKTTDDLGQDDEVCSDKESWGLSSGDCPDGVAFRSEHGICSRTHWMRKGVKLWGL